MRSSSSTRCRQSCSRRSGPRRSTPGSMRRTCPKTSVVAASTRVSLALVERELGRTSFALHHFVARPSRILMGCTGEQVEQYLLPTVRGEKQECLAITEPGAGSDVRGMTTSARRDGDGWVINGTKHFISHADISDYIILFAATGRGAVVPGSPQADLVVPRRHRPRRSHHHEGVTERLAPRLPPLRAPLRQRPRPRERPARRRGQRLRPHGPVARRDPPGGRRQLGRTCPAGSRRGARLGVQPRAVRPDRSASSRGCRSSSPTPRSRSRQRSC